MTNSDPSKVQGVNQQEVLTGQVPIGITCHNHNAVAHDAARTPDKTFCNRCGRDDSGVMRNKPNGGWA